MSKYAFILVILTLGLQGLNAASRGTAGGGMSPEDLYNMGKRLYDEGTELLKNLPQKKKDAEKVREKAKSQQNSGLGYMYDSAMKGDMRLKLLVEDFFKTIGKLKNYPDLVTAVTSAAGVAARAAREDLGGRAAATPPAAGASTSRDSRPPAGGASSAAGGVSAESVESCPFATYPTGENQEQRKYRQQCIQAFGELKVDANKACKKLQTCAINGSDKLKGEVFEFLRDKGWPLAGTLLQEAVILSKAQGSPASGPHAGASSSRPAGGASSSRPAGGASSSRGAPAPAAPAPAATPPAGGASISGDPRSHDSAAASTSSDATAAAPRGAPPHGDARSPSAFTSSRSADDRSNATRLTNTQRSAPPPADASSSAPPPADASSSGRIVYGTTASGLGISISSGQRRSSDGPMRTLTPPPINYMNLHTGETTEHAAANSVPVYGSRALNAWSNKKGNPSSPTYVNAGNILAYAVYDDGGYEED